MKPVLIIDARYVADYLNGHIPRAINIPVDCDESGIDDALRGIDRRTKIIVYCQSTACDFDETIASAIQQRGFHDIAIFP